MNSPWLLPFWIALGAIPGALARHYLIILFTEKLGTNFPFGTFFVNLSGSVLMGFSVTLIDKNIPWLNGLIIVGFIASYTTFSTYVLDTSKLGQQKRYASALIYFIGSPLGGLLGLKLGIFLAG
ncbi:crcB protein [Gloeomargarita lithophora Alchichica-D10]|uniref:Fluoride-specific ion channel FluC n=1 Tax=Gloeomargarita lithophora Alchichica-D10 TaxID=1188229 RepID=A0A1J0AEX9_9CYAN|nr:fluoride efflux transporter CrcB [Gloeomargarita lithophora]APB34459.1 crcB protein [Gloeomargarita lithophora Alchichica-D10]